MAIDVRTSEDLNKVFEDIFRLLYNIQHEVSNIEAELHKMNTKYIVPHFPATPPPIVYGPGSTKWIDNDTDMTKEIQGIIKAFKNDKKDNE